MSEADTQPVANATETVVPSAAEAASAQNDTSSLDALLNEFNTETTKQPAPVAAVQDNKSEVLQQRLDALERQIASERETKDFGSAIKEVKGDLDIPDWAVRGYLSSEAEADPRINKIWEQRHQNPAAAKKLLSGLKAKFAAEQAKRPDPEATSDKLAVAAAVRGTSTKVPEEKTPDYGAMDNAAFAKELAKFGI